MPPPKSNPAKHTGNSLSLFISIASGVFAFATISLVISRFGVAPIPTLIFSGLSGLAVTGFVWRERSLLKSLEKAERDRNEHVTHLESELDYLYERSTISLIEYDASSLMVGRISSGFYQLMGFDPSRQLQGKQLDLLLGIDASKLERLTERIKRNNLKQATSLSCRRVGGDVLDLNTTGRFFKDRYVVELCLVCSPDNFKRYAELQQMMEDLDRFRKGMLRREKRIIDLKNEVNGLLAMKGQAPRYAVTAAAETGRIADMLTEIQQEKKTHE